MFSSKSFAQEKQKPLKYYSTELFDEINATEEQRTALTALETEYKAKLAEVKANKSLSKEEAKEERSKLTKERSKKYYKILTPEQGKAVRAKAKAIKEANAAIDASK
ncbi:hypothetical protein G5B00_14590 [Parapedobacter sp. SGR-10]|uniref:hypothetical protein n=1 Tax=Parapedobacter sp. SGR-10 TaxID=2710879 RepID=UPI0013D8D01B|nr:hypothetical protein [Parapedobacter sp. SGR-10]NGF57744.1 hypothetical protein [Parapedobacter sp. SGR-10]